jgi:tetratricopeptide (TPR) repeat protein
MRRKTLPAALLLVMLLVGARREMVAADTCDDALRDGLSHFAQLHLGAAHFDQAEKAYHQAAENAACAYEAHWRLADLELVHGSIETTKKKKLEHFERGMKYAARAIEINHDGKEGYYFHALNLGRTVELRGILLSITKVYTIKQYIDRALEIDPNFVPAMVVRARMTYELPSFFSSNKPKAEALFKRALQLDPHYENAYLEYAAFLIKDKKYPAAAKLLDQVTAPDFPHAFASAWVLIYQPRAAELREQIRRAAAGG